MEKLICDTVLVMEQQIQELQNKIEELYEINTENQRMIKSLYRRAQVASYFVAVKWAAIVILTIMSLYYIQPYLETMMKFYTSFGGSDATAVQDVQGIDTTSILNLFKAF